MNLIMQTLLDRLTDKYSIEFGTLYDENSDCVLWKVVFGDSRRYPSTGDTIHVLAPNALHACAIAESYSEQVGGDDIYCSGTIYSVEQVDCIVVADPRFIINNVVGSVVHPGSKR